MDSSRLKSLGIALALLLCCTGVALADGLPLPIVDPTTPAKHDTEPVVLSGALLGDWAAPQNFTFKVPFMDLMKCRPSIDFTKINDPNNAVSQPGEGCDHNNYTAPELDSENHAGDGTPVDQLLGYRWDAKTSRWRQIPFQVDEQFTRYLDNAASGFAFYSGDDQHTTYAYDREGFRWTKQDPNNPCVAMPDSAPAVDPVHGLDTNDEVSFMASDAGPQPPAGTGLPPGIDSAKEVAINDPQDPGAAPSYVYVMKAKAGGPKPAFNASNGYVRYYRDADSGVFLFSQSNYKNYGNAAKGHFYDPATGLCRGADPKDIKDPKTCQTKDGDPVESPGDVNAYGVKSFYDCPQRRRPSDRAWITTPKFQFRYDGRWLLTKLQESPDGGQTYGPDMIDRWKARAFAQDPESDTPCCGYEEEDNNWGGSSTLLGERVGPVRAIRETWGSDSGTNVIRRETFYRDEIRQKTWLRVHPIPPLDGIYAQWDFNAGQVDTYYNPNNPGGVKVDGHNDEAFGNLDDPCTAHYDQNDTGQYTQGYRSAYKQLSLCDPKCDPAFGTGQCLPQYHLSADMFDPTFSPANSTLGWNQVTGPAGTVVDRYQVDKATDLTPGGLAQSAFAVPYYRDDSCFDDGTGSDPGPKLVPRGRRDDPRETTLPDGTARKCWDPAKDGTTPPDGDPRYFQGDIGTHGLHILMIADSDNARQTVPLDEIVAEQRLVVLPPRQPNVGEQYGRGFEKPLVPLVSDFSAGPATTPEEPVGGEPAPAPDPGGDSNPGGSPTSGSPSEPAPAYPGAPAPAASPPANVAPEASEGGVKGVRASAQPCLAAGQRAGSKGIGGFHIGRRPAKATLDTATPVTGHPGYVSWCVAGGGRMVALLAANDVVKSVASSAPSTRSHGVRAGSTAAYAAKHLHNSIAIGKTLRVERGSGARIAVGLRGSHVRFVAVVAKTQSSAAALKRLYASF